jgi:cyanate permease
LRWYILALTALTIIFVGGASRFSLLVLFGEIAADLDLNLVAIGTIWGMDSLAGVFISIPGGLLLDRFGIKRSAIAVCLLGGVFCALRGLSGGFFGLAATTLIYGLVAAITITLAPKVTAIWFKGKHLGLINAVLFVVLVFGQMFGTRFSASVFSPLLGGWRNVLFAFGVPSILIGLLWFVARGGTRHDTGSGVVERSAREFRSILSRVIRIKGLWFLGLLLFAQLGSNLAVNSYLPLYLRGIGWSADSADSALTLMIGVSCLGIIPVALISDRLRMRKLIVVFTMLLMAVSLGLMFIARDHSITTLLIITGLLRAIPGPILNTLVIELEEVQREYVGTAVGMMYTIGMIGGFVLPPLGNSFASISPALPFVFWAVLYGLSVLTLFFVKESKGTSA